MFNLFDYVHWRSDLSFDQAGLNEVDFAIFSQIVMIPYSLSIDMPQLNTNKSISLEQLGLLIQKNKTSFVNNIGLIIPVQLVDLIIKVCNSNRYKNIILKNYISDICINKEMQFTALTLDLEDDIRVVVFSGTDDTIIGWKENFNMMFTYPTEAQKSSLSYLEKVSKGKDLYIVGHSKGGNLSMFSALNTTKRIYRKIKHVYCFDAPGLSEDIILDEDNKERLEKIIGYSPQTAIIGRLFNHYEKEKVIYSNNLGLYQHDLLSWEVEVDHFKEISSRDNDSIYIENKINTMLSKMTPIMREEFVEVGYGLFLRTKSQTLSELNRSKIKLMKQFLNVNKADRKILGSTLIELLKDKIVAKNILFVVKESIDKGKEKKKLIKKVNS